MFIRKRGFGKRAQLDDMLFWFIDLVLLMIVFWFMVSFIDRVAESTTFEKRFLARDSALLIDALHVSPYNSVINYSQNTFWFSFNFDRNKVEVYDSNEKERFRQSSYFTEDKSINFVHRELTPEKKIEDKESFIEKYFLPASLFYTSKPEIEEGMSLELVFAKLGKKIIIDEKDKIDLTPEISYTVPDDEKQEGSPPVINEFVIDPKFLTEEQTNLIENSYIAVLRFAGNDYDMGVNNLKIYISSDEERMKKSKTLSQIIIHNIQTNTELKEIIKNRILVELTDYAIVISDNFPVLEKGTITILAEIGNTNIPKEKNILYCSECLKEIEQSINSAIEQMLK